MIYEPTVITIHITVLLCEYCFQYIIIDERKQQTAISSSSGRRKQLHAPYYNKTYQIRSWNKI
jgi:hypothetical protein